MCFDRFLLAVEYRDLSQADNGSVMVDPGLFGDVQKGNCIWN